MALVYCEYCGKEAFFMCGECKWTAYCSREHQLEHWRVHREHCSIVNSYRLRKEEEEMNKIRCELRHKYFDNYMHKIYDNCIKNAEEMVRVEQKHIGTTREIFNELEYGITMCLYARSWLNVRNGAKATIVIKSYIEEKMHFLKDLRDVVSFESLQKQERERSHRQVPKEQITITSKEELGQSRENSATHRIDNSMSQDHDHHFGMGDHHNNRAEQGATISSELRSVQLIVKEFAIKKVSLVASVANILHAIDEPVIQLYEIYTAHIEKMFGRDSYEASNCFFMVGSHYMEKEEFYKAIACFMRASELRGNMAGDCYYNLGIIFKLLSKSSVSLMMFENAAKLRENQFGENSLEVADVYHNLALINQSLGNFKDAIENLEKIALIYSKDKNSAEYKKAKESIVSLETAFRNHMQKQASGANMSPNFMTDLKKTIRKASKVPDDTHSEHSHRDEKEEAKNKSSGGNNYIKITDQFLQKLNALESLYLSELQIELGKCDSVYMAASAVGSSLFLKVLKANKLLDLIQNNETLFKHVSIEKLSKRGIKDHIQMD